MTQCLTIKAEFIKPGDFLSGEEVLWAINDYLRAGSPRSMRTTANSSSRPNLLKSSVPPSHET